ncbi:Clp protease ClpP [Mameliella alba]|nr:Clp protease ClpP [Mameliella alba]MBY6172448.1 Clp protease ClpP [Mameliella alba]MBY6177462.1 Clp protease ClpP [Mameliella alba]
MKFAEIMARALQPKGGPRAALSVRALDEEGAAEILVYDQIGFWGVTAEDFVTALRGIDAQVIHLRIDCPGGDVFMARAMKTALEQHSAKVVAHVDGLAASAASYLMLGADEVEIAQGAFVMIHNAWTITLGDKLEHSKAGDLLSKIDGAIRADYAAKTGRDPQDFAQMMDDETWLTADEAVELGLADRVYDREGGASNRFDLSVYDNAPAALIHAEEPDKELAAHRAASLRKLEFFERVAP